MVGFTIRINGQLRGTPRVRVIAGFVPESHAFESGETLDGIDMTPLVEGGEIIESLGDRVLEDQVGTTLFTSGPLVAATASQVPRVRAEEETSAASGRYPLMLSHFPTSPAAVLPDPVRVRAWSVDA